MRHPQNTTAEPTGTLPDPDRTQTRQAWERLQDSRAAKALVGVILAGAVVIAGIGFAGSYAAVRTLALDKGFGWFANVFPIGVDAGIVVLLALDLLLTWLRIPFPLLRQTAWLLTAATIAFNGAAAWPDKLGVGMHAIIPVLFVVSVEAARHAIGRVADITADKHMEGVRLTRWVLAPLPTFKLWRRMKLWELRSYEEVIRREQDRLVYRSRLRARYGVAWRRRAPIEAMMPLRLARYGVPLSETADAGLLAAGIEAPELGWHSRPQLEAAAEPVEETLQDAVDRPVDEPPVELEQAADAPAPVLLAAPQEPAGQAPEPEPIHWFDTSHPGNGGDDQRDGFTEPAASADPANGYQPDGAPQGDDVEARFGEYRDYVREQGTFPDARQFADYGREHAAETAAEQPVQPAPQSVPVQVRGEVPALQEPEFEPIPARPTVSGRVQATLRDDGGSATGGGRRPTPGAAAREQIRQLFLALPPEEQDAKRRSDRDLAKEWAPLVGLSVDTIRKNHLAHIRREVAAEAAAGAEPETAPEVHVPAQSGDAPAPEENQQ